MEKRLFIKGNEALARGAIKAGCRYYFGYPITPQNDIPEYLSKHLAKVEGCFIQAESEVASINMLLGASAAGARAMTSSSSPGISLMQEGISYLAGSELPGGDRQYHPQRARAWEEFPPPRGIISRPPGEGGTGIIAPSSSPPIPSRRCMT